MSDQINIRKATRKDLPFVLKLFAQKDMDNGQILRIEEAERIFDKFSEYPSYTLYVALLEDKVVGTFELLIMDNLAHQGKPSGIVEDVVVDETYQSKGIGKNMMDFAMQVCRENNCYKLALSSNMKRERAHKFYENLGFILHGYSYSIEL